LFALLDLRTDFHLRQKRPDILVGPHGGALLHAAPFRCRFTIAYAVSKRPTLLSSAVLLVPILMFNVFPTVYRKRWLSSRLHISMLLLTQQFHLGWKVEMKGLEPMTYALQRRRSPN
jgi:hypothetical protein